MLGLIAIYYIGKTFYTLAEYHAKNIWGFAFAGIGMFYGSQLVFGAILALVFIDSFDSMNEIALNVGGLFIGALCTVIFYNHLKNKWENQVDVISNPDILDDII